MNKIYIITMSNRIVDRFKYHYTRSYHSIMAVRKHEINNSHFIFNKNMDYNTTKVANRGYKPIAYKCQKDIL